MSLLGFDAAAKLALGELPHQGPPFTGFTQFSQPQPRARNNVGLTEFQSFPLLVQRSIPFSFTPFSEPLAPKRNYGLDTFQPFPLIVPEPPPPVPFTGFTEFSQPLPRRHLAELSSFQPLTLFEQTPIIVDTRDGGWIKRKKKPQRDLIQDELDEKARRRAAIALALYGPAVVPQPLPIIAPPLPPNVDELAKVIVLAREAERRALQAEIDEDDEDVLEMILREIL